jgi:hypothetical protein
MTFLRPGNLAVRAIAMGPFALYQRVNAILLLQYWLKLWGVSFNLAFSIYAF